MWAEPPENGQYLVTAYVVAVVLLAGYWARLWRRGKKMLSESSAGRSSR